MHEAVKNDDVVEMQSMIQQGAGLNDVDQKFKFTPLHWAAHQGALEVQSTAFIINFKYLSMYNGSLQLQLIIHNVENFPYKDRDFVWKVLEQFSQKDRNNRFKMHLLWYFCHLNP